MTYRILYNPKVLSEDLSLLNRDLHDRIIHAIERRLTTEPLQYGEPLRHRFKGCWKLRVGDYRIVYMFFQHVVLIVAIRHRKNVYALLPHRILWRP